MAKLTLKKVKGKDYLYLEESLRVGDKVRKLSKYLGPKGKVSKLMLREAEAEYETESLSLKAELSIKLHNINHYEYPLNYEEAKKIEEMNLKYKEIMRKLHPKDLDDLNQRFIANYVFESNALEGNSLTLKNVAEIVFENRISTGKNLREIYDAKNSYNAFLYLQKIRTPLTHDFIIKLHAMLMKNIDSRLGYRSVPIMLIGKPLFNAPVPKKVHLMMEKLLSWYNAHEDKIHPLELAFKFHSKFEKIHPFCDGNGRGGRFLLNYILMRKGYFPIIIRKTTRNAYLKALEAADRGEWMVLMRFALKHYKETFRKFFEVYYEYAISTTEYNKTKHL